MGNWVNQSRGGSETQTEKEEPTMPVRKERYKCTATSTDRYTGTVKEVGWCLFGVSRPQKENESQKHRP